MYENKKTFESILVLIVDLCSLIVSMGIASGSVMGILLLEGLSMDDQIWLLLFRDSLYGLIFVLMIQPSFFPERNVR